MKETGLLTEIHKVGRATVIGILIAVFLSVMAFGEIKFWNACRKDHSWIFCHMMLGG